MKHQGLFIGLTTLDCIYLSQSNLQTNQKIVAIDHLTVAGGPATNAALAFSSLGNQGILMNVLGEHPLSQIIKQELTKYNLKIIDLIPTKTDTPPVSSIIVTASTGERSIISINALKSQGNVSQIPINILADLDILLLDGHQIEVGVKLATEAQARKIPVVLDGGSWKPGLEQVLPFVDYAICSANFFPPHCNNTQAVFNFLVRQGVKEVAITQGEQPILYLDNGNLKTISIVPTKVIDTLGAGDIFHGAFCHFILATDFVNALSQAAQIASQSCQFFGTRSWQDYILKEQI